MSTTRATEMGMSAAPVVGGCRSSARLNHRLTDGALPPRQAEIVQEGGLKLWHESNVPRSGIAE